MHLYLILVILSLAACCAVLFCRMYRTCRDTERNIRIIRQIFNNIDAYILFIDEDFNVLNTNYYDLTGSARSAVPPKVGNLLRCRNGEDAGECGTHALCATCPVRRAIARAFATRGSFSKLEVPMTLYTSPDHDRTLDCEVSATGHYLSVDGKARMILTVHDITHEKQIQQELLDARDRAEKSDRMKTLFLANTTHELRTPLNAIVGFSELLAEELPAEEKREYVRLIRTNNEVLLQLVNDILDLSRIEAGTMEFTYAETEVDAMMEELEWFYRSKQPEPGPVEIRFRRPETTCKLVTDRTRLSQVISNFLSNALKYTSKGEIVFGYEDCGAELRFFVRDTGTGIPEERLGEVFQRFAKIGSHKQGIGIGLAICKSVVESMGGRIGVESRVGEGSTFWFTLPRRQELNGAAATDVRPAAAEGCTTAPSTPR